MMSAAGPDLPPHLLAKRKRQAELEEAAAASENTSRPETPPEKKKRVQGPSLPPAPLDERPSQPAEESENDSDSNDDWGPAPAAPGSENANQEASRSFGEAAKAFSETTQEASKTKRDEWMMIPPSQDDLASRMDPTKLRARGFNTGKSAKAPGGKNEVGAIWTETPEQKRQRLRNEVMGVSSTEPEQNIKAMRSKKDEEMARKVREHTEKQRGKSLVEEHQKKPDKEKEDDPSKRVFDYEKDMGTGGRIGHAQKAEMLKKAKDFGSRFSSGSYL